MTTQALTSGTVSRPPCSTRPLTLTAWENSAGGMPTSSNRLRRKLAEIFRIEVLEVRLQRVGVEGTATTGLDGAFTGVDGRELEQRLARHDRRLEPQRQRDRIGGTGIDLNDRIAPIDMQLGEVGVVLHLRDDHLAQLGAQPDDHLLEQIVRQRAGEFYARQLHREPAGLPRSPGAGRREILPPP